MASLAVTGWLVRRRLRRGWLALVPIALVVGAGAAGTLVALGPRTAPPGPTSATSTRPMSVIS
jgi:hypothetical protein